MRGVGAPPEDATVGFEGSRNAHMRSARGQGNGGGSPGAGAIVLLGAPIGAASDASPRFRDALARCDVVAAEDTRRLRHLCAALGIELSARVVSYFEGNEQRRTEELLEQARAGRVVGVVTDAGMPAVSDPGHLLTRRAVQEGVDVRCVPGPSAVTAALALSGLPSSRFCFEGFLPRRPGPRRRMLAELVAERRTMVFFESPHRLAATLRAMAESFGADRRAAACRELTKVHEEVRRDTLGNLAQWAADGVRGEVTLVVAGVEATPSDAQPEELAMAVASAQARGETRKDAMREVAQHYGVPRREVYDAVLAQRDAAEPDRG
jgi:16S rRNA (cytidine1402-2'-O)-methyltransferase